MNTPRKNTPAAQTTEKPFVDEVDRTGFDPSHALGDPGAFPFTRAFIERCTAIGCGRCGSSPAYGTAEDTNRRFKFLLSMAKPG